MAHTKAERHLARRDPILKALIKQVGPCTLRFEADGYSVLVRSIIAQQISSKAAVSIGNKVLEVLGAQGFTPQALDRASDKKLREAGLSANKLLSLRDLTGKVLSGEVPIEKLPAMEDEDVIQTLIPVRGIGRWTAEMFLIFHLGRMDVWPVDDLGVREGWRLVHGLVERPTAKGLAPEGDRYRPIRSAAAWYCWRAVHIDRERKAKAG